MKIHSSTLRKFNGNDYKGTICPTEVPDSILNEQWAEKIHGQSLHRLNERGGMGINEIMMNIKKLDLYEQRSETIELLNELKELISKHNGNA